MAPSNKKKPAHATDMVRQKSEVFTDDVLDEELLELMNEEKKFYREAFVRSRETGWYYSDTDELDSNGLPKGYRIITPED